MLKIKTKKDKSQENFYNDILWHLSKLARLRFWFLASKTDARFVAHVYLFVTSFLSIMVLGLATYFCSVLLIFPSLGPTVFLQYYAPSAPMSSPKHSILGHLLGCIVGLVAYYIITLFNFSANQMNPQMVLILAFAVATCGAIMSITDLLHPPAASTVLLAAFGNLGGFVSTTAFILSLIIVTYLAWAVHKISGVKYPLWQPFEEHKGPKIQTKLGQIDLSKKKGAMTMEEIASRLASRQKLK